VTAMPSPEEYRAKAEECLRMASRTTDALAASLLHMAADDYMALAEGREPVVQQQQQIQSENREAEDK